MSPSKSTTQKTVSTKANFFSTSFKDSRWQWMAGSAAALSATATGASMAAPAQITLSGNQLTVGSDNIDPDLTGDGIVDLPNLNIFRASSNPRTSYGNGKFFYSVFNRVGINSGLDIATRSVFFGKRFGIASNIYLFSSTSGKSSRLGSSTFYTAIAGPIKNAGYTPQSASAAIPVTFSDANINGGSSTSGFLEVRAFNSSRSSHTIQFLSLSYNDVSADLNTALRLSINSKLKKLKKQLKKAKKSGKSSKVKKIKKLIKEEVKRLKALS